MINKEKVKSKLGIELKKDINKESLLEVIKKERPNLYKKVGNQVLQTYIELELR